MSLADFQRDGVSKAGPRLPACSHEEGEREEGTFGFCRNSHEVQGEEASHTADFVQPVFGRGLRGLAVHWTYFSQGLESPFVPVQS